MAIYTRERKYKQKINEIVVRGNMYTKMNFLCTKLRKVSTKGKKKSKWLFKKWWSLIWKLLQRVVKFEMHSQPYWNNYFNSGRYFNSGWDVKLSLKFILNHYWNNYFNSGRYFNSGCNMAVYFYDDVLIFFKAGTLYWYLLHLDNLHLAVNEKNVSYLKDRYNIDIHV